MMALRYGLMHRDKVHGALVLGGMISGGFPDKGFTDYPIDLFVAHGTDDQVIPIQKGREIRDQLQHVKHLVFVELLQDEDELMKRVLKQSWTHCQHQPLELSCEIHLDHH